MLHLSQELIEWKFQAFEQVVSDEATRIVVRARQGLDDDGRPFVPYSPKYAKCRQASGRQTSPVDLRLTGAMLASSRMAVYDWLARFRQGGASAWDRLKDRPRSGRPAARRAAESIRAALASRPTDHGYRHPGRTAESQRARSIFAEVRGGPRWRSFSSSGAGGFRTRTAGSWAGDRTASTRRGSTPPLLIRSGGRR